MNYLSVIQAYTQANNNTLTYPFGISETEVAKGPDAFALLKKRFEAKGCRHIHSPHAQLHLFYGPNQTPTESQLTPQLYYLDIVRRLACEADLPATFCYEYEEIRLLNEKITLLQDLTLAGYHYLERPECRDYLFTRVTSDSDSDLLFHHIAQVTKGPITEHTVLDVVSHGSRTHTVTFTIPHNTDSLDRFRTLFATHLVPPRWSGPSWEVSWEVSSVQHNLIRLTLEATETLPPPTPSPHDNDAEHLANYFAQNPPFNPATLQAAAARLGIASETVQAGQLVTLTTPPPPNIPQPSHHLTTLVRRIRLPNATSP